MYVHGARARPRVRKCEIANSKCVGVFVEDGAEVSLAQPYFPQPLIAEVELCSTVPFPSSQGLFEGCNIHENKLAGVWIKSNANPRFFRNKVHHGRDCGFFVFDSGKGRIESNDIHSNR